VSEPAPPPRPPARRKRDTLARLEREVDLWVASASAGGEPYLVPLSYHWDGSALTVATPGTSRTARDLLRAGRTRVALDGTRDVVVIDGRVEPLARGADVRLEDAHARATGFDPRPLEPEYVYLRITPQRIQAWREENELEGRELMRRGRWLV
jgi:hypothetical protein